MVDENVFCPDCEYGLVASSSERGDYFCPDCVTPVNNQKAVFYCVECGEKEISSHQRICSNCRDAREQSHHLSDASRDITWGEDAPDDDLGSFAARDCSGCGVMLIPFNFILQPLHDGEGNYYVGHTWPSLRRDSLSITCC